jgi:hypothetical protein
MKRIKYDLDSVKFGVWKHLNDAACTRVRAMVSSHCSECGYGYSRDEAFFSPSLARFIEMYLYRNFK